MYISYMTAYMMVQRTYMLRCSDAPMLRYSMLDSSSPELSITPFGHYWCGYTKTSNSMLPTMVLDQPDTKLMNDDPNHILSTPRAPNPNPKLNTLPDSITNSTNSTTEPGRVGKEMLQIGRKPPYLESMEADFGRVF